MNVPAEALRPIPFHVLTGFLGAGKTTRLNRWLADPAFANTLVIVNEYGAVGLDHLLVEGPADEVVLLAAGCACCALRGDLAVTLEDLLRRRDNGRMPFFRRVVLETSGLADPLPILRTILEHPYFSKRFAPAGMWTLVDAATGIATLDAHPEARRQAALADILMVTKRELASPPVLDALEARLRTLNPSAERVEEADGFEPADLLAPRFGAESMARIGSEAHVPTPSHRGDGSIRAFGFLDDRPIGEGQAIVFLEAMRALHGARLLRLKGLVRTHESPERPLAIHAVQHLALPPHRLEHWTGPPRTRLAFVTDGVDEAEIRAFWDALAGS